MGIQERRKEESKILRAQSLHSLKNYFLFFFSPPFCCLTPLLLSKIFCLFCYNFSFHSIKVKENQEDGTSFQKIIDHKIFLNITLLFANFELHCDSYTFSLRLNLKQLNNSQFMMNEHAKNISQRSLALSILR